MRPHTTHPQRKIPYSRVIYEVLLWADMNAATPLGAGGGRSLISLQASVDRVSSGQGELLGIYRVYRPYIIYSMLGNEPAHRFTVLHHFVYNCMAFGMGHWGKVQWWRGEHSEAVLFFLFSFFFLFLFFWKGTHWQGVLGVYFLTHPTHRQARCTPKSD